MMGRGINADNIAGVAVFLCGGCSCTVKEFNRGTDLLFAADWNSVLREGTSVPVEPPTSAGEKVPIPQASAKPPPPAGGEAPAGGGDTHRLVTVGVVCLLTLVAGGTLALLRWKK
jgi:hypothetical protein